MAVRTNLFGRLFGQSEGFSLRQCWNFDFHLDGNAEASPLTRPDGSVACDDCSLYVLPVLPGHEFNSAAIAGSVPRRKQVFRRRGVGQTGSTHFLPDRQIDAHRMIGSLRVSVSSTGVTSGLIV
jgi:hypothetical protein